MPDTRLDAQRIYVNAHAADLLEGLTGAAEMLLGRNVWPLIEPPAPVMAGLDNPTEAERAAALAIVDVRNAIEAALRTIDPDRRMFITHEI